MSKLLSDEIIDFFKNNTKECSKYSQQYTLKELQAKYKPKAGTRAVTSRDILHELSNSLFHCYDVTSNACCKSYMFSNVDFPTNTETNNNTVITQKLKDLCFKYNDRNRVNQNMSNGNLVDNYTNKLKRIKNKYSPISNIPENTLSIKLNSCSKTASFTSQSSNVKSIKYPKYSESMACKSSTHHMSLRTRSAAKKAISPDNILQLKHFENKIAKSSNSKRSKSMNINNDSWRVTRSQVKNKVKEKCQQSEDTEYRPSSYINMKTNLTGTTKSSKLDGSTVCHTTTLQLPDINKAKYKKKASSNFVYTKINCIYSDEENSETKSIQINRQNYKKNKFTKAEILNKIPLSTKNQAPHVNYKSSSPIVNTTNNNKLIWEPPRVIISKINKNKNNLNLNALEKYGTSSTETKKRSKGKQKSSKRNSYAMPTRIESGKSLRDLLSSSVLNDDSYKQSLPASDNEELIESLNTSRLQFKKSLKEHCVTKQHTSTLQSEKEPTDVIPTGK